MLLDYLYIYICENVFSKICDFTDNYIKLKIVTISLLTPSSKCNTFKKCFEAGYSIL